MYPSRVADIDPEDARAMADHERKARREQPGPDAFLALLAKAVAVTSQELMNEPPVRFEDWPSQQQAQCLYAARVAARWNDARVRRTVELHCRQALAVTRYSVPYAELAPRQQNAVNREVACVIHVFGARLTDHEVLHLGFDQRAVLEPERHAVLGGVQ